MHVNALTCFFFNVCSAIMMIRLGVLGLLCSAAFAQHSVLINRCIGGLGFLRLARPVRFLESDCPALADTDIMYGSVGYKVLACSYANPNTRSPVRPIPAKHGLSNNNNNTQHYVTAQRASSAWSMSPMSIIMPCKSHAQLFLPVTTPAPMQTQPNS